MGTKRLMLLPVAILSLIIFVGCDSLQGPAGEDGEDGKDGSDPTIDVSDISVTPKSLQVDLGGWSELEAAIVPSNATNQLVFWESSDEEIAQVDSNGVVTGITPGYTVEITATSDDGGHSDTVEVQVGKTGSDLIGEEGPAGGTVFYYDDYEDFSDWKYLELAPKETEWEDKEWGPDGLVGTNIDIGSGASNTEAIIAEFPESDTAAKLTDDLEYGGYDDWFLPSLYELLELDESFIEDDKYYWSSYERFTDDAFAFNINSTSDNTEPRSSTFRVRAIRAF